MAEINLNNRKNSKRRVPYVDLTPMVDLGFLLITFFMFTTTLTDAKAIDINMPYKPAKEQTAFIDTSTITIMLSKGHEIGYYCGLLRSAADIRMVPNGGVRDVIIAKEKQLSKLPAHFSVEAHKLHIIIKPTDESRYDDLVAILDEMLINAVPYYVIVDITPEEQAALTGRLAISTAIGN